MTNLSISSVRIVKSREQFDAPSGETFAVGEAMRIDESTGKVTPGNATSADEADVKGVACKAAVYAGETVTVVRKGLLDVGEALAGMDIDAPIYLSATDGLFADASPGTNEQQTATITGTPTGGTFTLTFAGATTATIAYDAAASAVQSALELLSTIGAGNVKVTGSAGGPYTVEFINDLADTNVAAMTASGAGLTGGTTPGVTIATAAAGVQEKICGRVAAAWGATTADKLFEIDL